MDDPRLCPERERLFLYPHELKVKIEKALPDREIYRVEVNLVEYVVVILKVKRCPTSQIC